MIERGSSQQWRAVTAAFDRLVTLAPDMRGSRLAAMDLDPAVADEIRTLLHGHDAQGILDRTLLQECEDESPAMPVVAGYRIERLLGRGGSSDVYLAHRAHDGFEQRLALKIIHADVRDRTNKVAGEARLLATLDHSGIAPLVDAGTMADGRHYLALAYVDGDEIAAWVARGPATLTARLDLFLQVCDAVSYAHARLVIHRDIKPANIRVDRNGRARLLDFGIARLLDAATLDYRTTRNIATPVYAAPEQLDGGDLSVATDVYALGALLFELLSGQPPWPTGRSPLPAIVHRIARPEPGPPSGVACDPVIDRARITGDLDAIVGKAMRAAPADRYVSVEALSRDVRRHLSHHPVHARTGARGYRLRRFLRRRRWPIAGGAAVLLAITGGAIGTAWQAEQAARERDSALVEAARLEAVNQAMILVFAGDRDGGVQSIEERARRLANTLPPHAGSAAAIAAIADLQLMMERPDDAKALLQIALRRRMGGVGSADYARLQLKLAAVLAREGRFDGAQILLAQADRFWRTDPDRYRRERVEAVGARAFILRRQGQSQAAIALLQANMAEADMAYSGYGRDLASRYTNLATRLREAGRLDEAAATVRRGERVLMQGGDRNAQPLLTLRRTEALVEEQRGDPRRAAAILRALVAARRAAFGPSPALAADLLHLGRLTGRLGRPDRAAAMLVEARTMFASFMDRDSDATLLADLMLVEALAAAGRPTQAAAGLDRIATHGDAIAASPLLTGLRWLARAQVAGRGDAARMIDAADAAFAKGGPSGAAYRPIVALRRSAVLHRAVDPRPRA
ncbi:hypothetical protein ASG29_15900 [Sphingomonas sp. Leaf412]|uniref:serine/threonine-protein kinase n=1 Tax=Sphingomonas sp. Leaf412 TaxID=1736370 RepID=UPI0006FA0D1D|nr:serine/threonine-protein kinase [Sphingomonas sp. Leaf412]KQT30989.1 hypothetical protein ASG29_15900 [Sphingomonas sp. Leaf412]